MKNPTSIPADAGLSPGLRRFILLTAAWTGAAVMIVEILGARILAPYVGTSHYVWTAQIAVTLFALAAGYYGGGRMADRTPRLSWLYAGLLCAAVYLCGVTLVLRPVAQWCLGFTLAVGSLLASTLLFFVPLALMAMTAPFLVRFLTASVATVGGSVGRLIALSTLGSFVGTVLIGYVLIPFLPNSITLLLTAGLLGTVSVIYFLVWGRGHPPLAPVLLAVGLGALAGGLGWYQDQRPRQDDFQELFRGNSNFGELLVLQHASGKPRYYLNDLLVQNTYDPEAKAGMSTFSYLLHGLARSYTPQVDSALCIGMGAGIVPGQLAREGVRVDVVEINEKVVHVAASYFDCPVDLFRVHIGDGRQFLNRTTNRYDTIILDAFLGDSSPCHLMSREAFESMRRLLRADGTLVINCFADFNPRKDFFGASLDKTLRSVFRSVKIHSTGSGNVYFIASDRTPFEPLRTPNFDHVHPSVHWQAQAAFGNLMHANPDRGIVLTDDYNPVEAFDAANREEIRHNLARSMLAR